MKTMNVKSNRAVGVFLIFLMSFYSVGAVQAKVNAADELWQEDMLSVKGSASGVGAPEGPEPPGM